MARFARSLRATLALLGLGLALTPAGAQALPPSAPDSSAFATNGKVNAVVNGGGITYIGGEFTEVRAVTGGHARLDPTTGKRSAPSPLVPFGTTQVSIPDGAGGVYIGGGFSSVGSFNRHRVAHILADGSVDPDFNPPLFLNGPNPGGSVHALALGSDGALYVGGDFTGARVGNPPTDFPRNKILKLNAANGNLFTTWNPNATHATATPVVTALAVSGSELFVGGIFDDIGGQPRESIAKLSTASGNAFSAWNPDPVKTESFNFPIIRSFALSGGNLFVGGLFSEIGGLTRNNVAKLSTVSGNAFSAWDPDARQGTSPGTAAVDALALSDDATQVFLGGQFTTINEAPTDLPGQRLDRSRIAKVSATSSNAFTTWDPNADAAVDSLAVSGDQVFASGLFENIGGQNRPAIAKLSGTSGNAFGLFNVNPRSFGGTIGQIFTLAFSGGQVYAGGTFDSVNNVTRNRIAALDANGFPTSFNPDANGPVRSLALSDSGSELYAGGEFTQIGGLTRNGIGKLSITSGNAFSSFDPNASGGTPTSVNALDVFGDVVYAGGDFTNIGTQSRNRLAKLSATNGNAFSWNPDPDGAVRAIAASDTGSEVFVGGAFSNIGTLERRSLAKLSATSGNAFTTFQPGDVGGGEVNALEVDGGEVYVGGSFDFMGGPRRNLAKVSGTSANAFSAWNPDVDGRVNALDRSGSVLYAGGEFSSVKNNTLFRSRLAAISTTSGDPFSTFTPTSFGEVFGLAATPTSVHIGEGFNGPNLFLDRGYAQFTQP